MTRLAKVGAVAVVALAALGVRSYVARLTVAGATNAFPMSTPSALAHYDHSPRHGGLVLMNGDTHFEVVVDADSRYAVYFTDAVRAPLPASAALEVHVAVTPNGRPAEIIPLQIDPTGTHWVGRGTGIDDLNAVLRITHVPDVGAPYWIDVPVSAWPRAIASLQK